MGELSVTAIDAVVVIIILLSAIYAALRGLIRETFAILQWVASAYLALRLTPLFQPLLRETISSDWLAWIVVFAAIFVMLFIPLSILSNRLSAAVQKSDVGPIDRTLGFVFGAARGLVILGAAYLVFAALVPVEDYPDRLTDARLFPLVRSTGELLRSLAPQKQGLDDRDSAAEVPIPVARPTPAKAYGADERRALDRLIQTNGGSGTPKR